VTGLFGDLLEQVKMIEVQTERILAQVDDASAGWRPTPNSWSVVECFEHLNVIGHKLVTELGRAVDSAKPLASAAPHRRYGLLARLVLWIAEPPPWLRMKTTTEFRPNADLALGEVASRFMELQLHITERLQRAATVDLTGIKIRHPAFPVRFAPEELFAMTITHQRRHLWQAEQVLLAPGFPNKT
jgi:hypothetical protein